MHTTPVSLLGRLRHLDEDRAWDRFVELCTPLLLYWARRYGMPLQDFSYLAKASPSRFSNFAAETVPVLA